MTYRQLETKVNFHLNNTCLTLGETDYLESYMHKHPPMDSHVTHIVKSIVKKYEKGKK